MKIISQVQEEMFEDLFPYNEVVKENMRPIEEAWQDEEQDYD